MEDCRELSECCRVTLRLPGLQGKCERQRMLPFLVFCGRGHQTALQQHTFCRPDKAKPPPGTTALAKHHLRPARQPCGNGAKVIATRDRYSRQLFGQCFLDQR